MYEIEQTRIEGFYQYLSQTIEKLRTKYGSTFSHAQTTFDRCLNLMVSMAKKSFSLKILSAWNGDTNYTYTLCI